MAAKVYTAQLVLVAVGLDRKAHIVDTENPAVEELVRDSSAQASEYVDVGQLTEPGIYVWEGDIRVSEAQPRGWTGVVPVVQSTWTGVTRRATLSDLAKYSRWRR